MSEVFKSRLDPGIYIKNIKYIFEVTPHKDLLR